MLLDLQHHLFPQWGRAQSQLNAERQIPSPFPFKECICMTRLDFHGFPIMEIRCDVWGQNLVWLTIEISLFLVVFNLIFSISLLACAWVAAWQDASTYTQEPQHVPVPPSSKKLKVLRKTGHGGTINTWVWEGTWECFILQLWSEASVGLRCPGLWWVVLLAEGHESDTTALLLHLPGHKLCDVILLPMALKHGGI